MKKILLLLFLSARCLLQGQSNVDALIAGLTYEKAADSLLVLGRKQMMRGKNDSAVFFLDKGFTLVQKAGDRARIAKYYVEKANIALFADKQKAISLLRQATPYLDASTDYKTREKYLLIMGKSFRHLSMTDSAIYYLRLCEKLNNEMNPYGNWVLYLETAGLFSETEGFEEAEKYLRKGYELTRAKGIRMDHGLMLSELLSFYSKKHQPEKFAAILKENIAFELGRKKDFTRDPVHSMFFMDWDVLPLTQKVEFMKEVKVALSRNDDIVNMMQANSMISSFYEKEGQPHLSLPYMLENVSIAARHDDLFNLFAYTNAVFRLQKKSGLINESVQTADRLLSLKDSIYRVQQRQLMFDLEKKYESEKKEKEILMLTSQHELSRMQLKVETEKGEALRRENQLKEDKLSKELLLRQSLERENILSDTSLAQQLRLNEVLEREADLKERELQKEKLLSAALIRENALKQESITKDKMNKNTLWAGIGLLILAGTIILGQYNRQLKKNRIIRKQAEEMEVLNREIHHRVKNNLQVISSLLDIQSQTLKDEEAAEVLKESRQRVQSMAFIHQNLYQSSSVQEIEIKNYVTNLADHLFQSYNVGKDKIRLVTDIDPVSLHTDTVVPLGMVLNELISNALKYAFPDVEEGEIKVTMKQQDNQLVLRVQDNGKGLPPGFDMSQLNSFGFKVIKAFAQKLKAKLTVNGNKGTDVQLIISKFKTV
jgi:two-component sensor histidine kinase